MNYTNISLSLSENNLHIKNSYLVKRKKDMKEIIEKFKKDFPNHILCTVPTFLLVSEWATHNLFYKLGLFKDRTKDVDLNYGKSWLINLAYLILGLFHLSLFGVITNYSYYANFTIV